MKKVCPESLELFNFSQIPGIFNSKVFIIKTEKPFGYWLKIKLEKRKKMKDNDVTFFILTISTFNIINSENHPYPISKKRN